MTTATELAKELREFAARKYLGVMEHGMVTEAASLLEAQEARIVELLHSIKIGEEHFLSENKSLRAQLSSAKAEGMIEAAEIAETTHKDMVRDFRHAKEACEYIGKVIRARAKEEQETC